MTAEPNNAASVQSNIGQMQNQLTIRPNMTTDLLAVGYLTAKAEGYMKTIFWETAPDLLAFLKWCERPDCVVVGAFVGPYLAGLGWLQNIKKFGNRKVADAGMVFFKQYQSRQINIDAGRLLLDYGFGEVGITTMCGMTPARNLAAVHFLRKFGFTCLDPIPGICSWMGEESAGVISHLTKDAWVKWREGMSEQSRVA